jgi:hypothetical protein
VTTTDRTRTQRSVQNMKFPLAGQLNQDTTRPQNSELCLSCASMAVPLPAEIQ